MSTCWLAGHREVMIHTSEVVAGCVWLDREPLKTGYWLTHERCRLKSTVYFNKMHSPIFPSVFMRCDSFVHFPRGNYLWHFAIYLVRIFLQYDMKSTVLVKKIATVMHIQGVFIYRLVKLHLTGLSAPGDNWMIKVILSASRYRLK